MTDTHSEPIPYRERLSDLRDILRRQGSMGLLLIDISELAQVEHHYGSAAFEKIWVMARDLLLELRGGDVRAADLLSVDDKGGDAFLVFLSPKRTEGRLRIADLRALSERVEEHLNRKLTRLVSPYLTKPRQVVVGFSLAFENPLVMPDRLVSRLVDEAWACVRVQRRERDLQRRCTLQEVLLEDKLATVFQPIVDLRDNSVLGLEALSRGPEGTVLHAPLRLFELAEKADLAFELDRKCRRRALTSARSLPEGKKLFINVLPSALYDPEFQGESLAEHLQSLGLRSDRIVLEITESSAIENYGVFAEALGEFTRVGFQIAVDDVGAGYSGLEKIAHLNPNYLKLDRELIKDIDSSYIRREMTRALKAFADKIGSTIIAEGIEREAELKALIELGIEYGQGFLLARPAAGLPAVLPIPRPRPSRGPTVS
ncbi:MAG TPA: EAL domain-containing protein [Vicinamibacteria bacterium]|nr:EAL domain-containing protein [Vicinamibacteria bacterium]